MAKTRSALDIHDELVRHGSEHDNLLRTMHTQELKQEEYDRRRDKVAHLDARIGALRSALRGVVIKLAD